MLAAVYLVSGYLKAVDPAQTRVAVKAYQLVSDELAEAIAAVLPYAEIAVGVVLLLGTATRLGAILSALLMVAFLIGVISAAARGLNIDCGCFGGGGAVAQGGTAYTAEILRDTGLLILSGYLIVRPRSYLAVDALAHRHRDGDNSDDGYDDDSDGASTPAGSGSSSQHGTRVPSSTTD